MADITFWKDEYQKFIDGVLREEQRQFLEKADLVGQEIAYLEENGANLLSDNPKHFVLFLHINNLINTLDPKGCYPRIYDEYSDSALEILDKYGEVNDDGFVIWLDKFLHDFWNHFITRCVGTSDYEWIIGRVKDAIVKKLKELYKRKWGYVDGKPLKSKEYWNYHYEDFLELLREDQLAFRGSASGFDHYIEWLTEEQEFLLAKHEPKDYVMYLYINQELNRLDPIGWGYPGSVWDEYHDYAWQIVDLVKTENDVSFTQRLTDYLNDFFDMFYDKKSPEFIAQTAEKMEGKIRGIELRRKTATRRSNQ